MTEVEWHTEQGEGWTFALLGRSMRYLGIEARGVLHVGGHLGEELPFYREQGFEVILFVEPDPESADALTDRLDQGEPLAEFVLVNAVGSTPGRTTFKRQDHRFLSGLVGRRDREPVAEFDVEVVTLAAIQTLPMVRERINVLVVDTQGTELDALASGDLGQFELVIVEAYGLSGLGRPPKVKSAAERGALDAMMAERGFEARVEWIYDRSGYSDVLYTPARQVAV